MVEAPGVEPGPDSLQESRSPIKLYPHWYSSLVRTVGFEPTADRLRAGYSTTELRPAYRGADGRNRSPDLLFTKQLLFQLSYVGSKIQVQLLILRQSTTPPQLEL